MCFVGVSGQHTISPFSPSIFRIFCIVLFYSKVLVAFFFKFLHFGIKFIFRILFFDFYFTLCSLVKCVAHIGSDSLCYFYFYFLPHTLIHTHTFPSVPSVQHLLNIRPFSLVSLTLSRSLFVFYFRSVSLAYCFTPSFALTWNIFTIPFMFGNGGVPPNCSGVSGALEGTSFQNHRPQRTHQTAYAKRKSRRRSVGHFIGEPIVDSQSRTLCIYLARAINCILFQTAQQQNSTTETNNTISKYFRAKRHDPHWKTFYFSFFTKIGKAIFFIPVYILLYCLPSSHDNK